MLLSAVAILGGNFLATASVDTTRVLNGFRPETAFGAGVDGQEKGDVDRSFLPANTKLMRSAGLRSLAYRLRTELGVESFHWNPKGTWSDSSNQRGYWTSSSESQDPVLKCYGYRLPRRGDTVDQANDDGYSRLDDGNLATFWKSNPYLDPAYTGDSEDAYPQWVVVDLKTPKKIDTLKVLWAAPFAQRYKVEYWRGANEDVGFDSSGAWTPACQPIDKLNGGNDAIHMDCKGKVRFVRLWLLRSSHTSLPSSHPDPRDSMGFAIREIQLGATVKGRFVDWVDHRPDKKQTAFFTSSTDPWGRDSDMDTKIEQPGFDLVARSGLTNNLPILVSVPALYDSPDNAAAEVAFLKARVIPIRGIEIGEEPDGQCVSPEHYAALYIQVARAIRKIDQETPLGGPSFQDPELDYLSWPEGRSGRTWLQRFLDYLKARKASDLFQFLSIEWYPFDDVKADTESQLLDAPGMLTAAIARLRAAGISTHFPWVIAEYGYSAFAAPQEVELPGAILNLDIVGKFLELGGSAAYLYGYEVNTPISEKDGLWGNLMMIQSDESGQAKYELPTYYAARMMTHDWCADPSARHSLVHVALSGTGSKALACYAVRRPGGDVSLLVLNKSKSKTVTLVVGQDGLTWTDVDAVQYGERQYRWISAEEEGHPAYSLPPQRFHARGAVTIPPYSITVLTRRAGTNPARIRTGTN